MSFYTRDKMCYLMSVPSGYVKIGISDAPARRLGEIQAYCYEPVRLVGCSWISQASPVSAAMMEHLVHFKLKPYEGARREWFAVDVEAAIAIWEAVYWFLAIPPGHPDLGRVRPDHSCRIAEAQKAGAKIKTYWDMWT